MIAGFHKIEYVHLGAERLNMKTLLGKKKLPTLTVEEIASDWIDLNAERHTSKLEITGSLKRGSAIYEGIVPIQINNVTPTKMQELSDLHGRWVLALITDNNYRKWLLGTPSTPAAFRWGMVIDPEPSGQNTFALELQVKQIFPPIPVI